jgi:hypothetical protein
MSPGLLIDDSANTVFFQIHAGKSANSSAFFSLPDHQMIDFEGE